MLFPAWLYLVLFRFLLISKGQGAVCYFEGLDWWLSLGEQESIEVLAVLGTFNFIAVLQGADSFPLFHLFLFVYLRSRQPFYISGQYVPKKWWELCLSVLIVSSSGLSPFHGVV